MGQTTKSLFFIYVCAEIGVLNYYSSLAIAQQYDGQRGYVQHHEYPLSLQYVFALVRKVVEERVDVDVSGGVDQGACSAFDKRIVAFTGLVLRDLLHVRFPVDLSVCRGGRGRQCQSVVELGGTLRPDQPYRGL